VSGEVNFAGGFSSDKNVVTGVSHQLKLTVISSNFDQRFAGIIKLGGKPEFRWKDYTSGDHGLDWYVFLPMLSEAYVMAGNQTFLVAGLAPKTIANTADDQPYNFLGMFNSSNVNTGVGFPNFPPTGGVVLQILSDIGNGFSIGGALENLNNSNPTQAGTAIGVINYDANGITAHATFLAGGVLDGIIENWGIHTGFSYNYDDIYKIRAAGAFDKSGYWNVLGTAQATFDMFTLAGSAEATSGNEVGFGVSASAQVTTSVKINAGLRWFDTNTLLANTESYDAAVQLVAAVTDTISLTSTVGITGNNYVLNPVTNVAYFGSELAWAPGGGFETSIGAKANSFGAYSITFKTSKEIK